jgi:ParB-like nuclease domain
MVRISDIAPLRCAYLPGARRYAALLRAGHRLPPIKLIGQPGRYRFRIFDGAHRMQAAKIVGRKTVEAVVLVDYRRWVAREPSTTLAGPYSWNLPGRVTRQRTVTAAMLLCDLRTAYCLRM